MKAYDEFVAFFTHLTVSTLAAVVEEMVDKYDLGADSMLDFMRAARGAYEQYADDEQARFRESMGNHHWATFLDLTEEWIDD